MCGGRWPEWAEVLPKQHPCSSDGQPSEQPEPHPWDPDQQLWSCPKLKNNVADKKHVASVISGSPLSRATNTQVQSTFWKLYVFEKEKGLRTTVDSPADGIIVGMLLSTSPFLIEKWGEPFLISSATVAKYLSCLNCSTFFPPYLHIWSRLLWRHWLTGWFGCTQDWSRSLESRSTQPRPANSQSRPGWRV